MKLLTNSVLAIALLIASLSVSIKAKADTVNARCSVYPKGEDRASWYGSCTFSQRQGFIGIKLQNGRRYDLRPVRNRPNQYRDQNSRSAYREMDGDRQIYRLARESVYVTFDTSAGNSGNPENSGGAQPSAGTPVSSLRDLVGARAGQAENVVTQRGYRFVKSNTGGNSVYSQWLEGRTNYCVTIRTIDGRYQSIVYAGGSFDCQN
ncbi:hypothetical protein F7734_33155 [Scytonema sp. UIC 10036]|uniref:hypothetical protein n=1 Tax=Scytonema sp. UIC 10036 TaxID=2304196 RepID=UPI0012DAB387|nr:hypothetical protein [Scytonema sp. UIC 10036]MUG96931.1 hypothetical protein [Scytonema sp. UIC 10036]